MRTEQWSLRRQALVPAVLVVALCVLALKILVAIGAEYRFYFPPAFASAFLTGREGYFWGYYCIAFYVHILVGPPVVLLALVLVLSGGLQCQSTSAARVNRRSGTVLWPLGRVCAGPIGFADGPLCVCWLAIRSRFSSVESCNRRNRNNCRRQCPQRQYRVSSSLGVALLYPTDVTSVATACRWDIRRNTTGRTDLVSNECLGELVSAVGWI